MHTVPRRARPTNTSFGRLPWRAVISAAQPCCLYSLPASSLSCPPRAPHCSTSIPGSCRLGRVSPEHTHVANTPANTLACTSTVLGLCCCRCSPACSLDEAGIVAVSASVAAILANACLGIWVMIWYDFACSATRLSFCWRGGMLDYLALYFVFTASINTSLAMLCA